MAKINYSFEKRQREIAKKKKKQESKQAKKQTPGDGARTKSAAGVATRTDA